MANIVDLRSDTVTRPTPAMRQAIANAEVGDDVLGDDPTVAALQERMAAFLKKDAALFVPSGTMANQLAIRAATEPGDDILAARATHCYEYEGGAFAALSGCSVRFVDSERGIFTPVALESVIRPPDVHFAHPRMVVIENTNNRGGGSVWPLERVAKIHAAAKRLNLHLHIDGARLWNAAIAAGCHPSEYAAHADSLSMCFSKAMGAPVGSILAGSHELITRARRFRKQFGGGMRQAGILAAAALHALDYHYERLAEDHANAAHFAQEIAKLPGILLDPRTIETNIVIFELEPALGPAPQFVERLRERDVWMLPTGPQSIRAVTHLDVNREQIDRALEACAELCQQAK